MDSRGRLSPHGVISASLISNLCFFAALAGFGIFLFYADYGDFGEALLEGGGVQFRGHAAHYVLRDDAVAALMAIEADVEWDIEENGVHFVLVVLGEFDPVLTLLRSEIGGIDIIHGTLRDQAGFQHGTQVGEDEILKTLLAHVVEK